MDKLSVIIPSRNEKYLPNTIDDIFSKAVGDIEILVILDGYWPDPPLKNDKRLILIHLAESKGLRPGVNAGAEIAKGKYLMKCDAHCMFEQGFDEILKKDCEDNWLVIPRRVSLDGEKWEIANTGRPPTDYEFISFYHRDLDAPSVRKANIWYERQKTRADILIDDNMSFQGSCWLMQKKHWDRLGPLEVNGWGTFILEPEELGNKIWLSGGRVIVNKNTKYAHWHKGKEHGRGYFIDRRGLQRGRKYNTEFWMGNKWLENWPKQEHPFEWLIDHFSPVPTWPDNWREIVNPNKYE